MKTIVGLFDTRSQAELAVQDLERAGYGRDRVSVVAGESRAAASSPDAHSETMARDQSVAEGAGTGAVIGGVTGGAAGLIASLAGLAIPGIGPVLAVGPIVATLTGAGVGAVAGGLVGALQTAGVPQEHARYYAEGVRRGGTLVTATAEDDEADRVIEIMNLHRPVDIEDRAAVWGRTAFAGTGSQAAPVATENRLVGAATTGSVATIGSAATTASAMTTPTSSERVEGEQHIPVVEEELRVGKREVETGGVRVNTRMEETPVQEQISLREEKVNVERRPTDRPATTEDISRAFQGGTIELTERTEEAVVQKEARVVEEVVVGKEATERTETVRDTVRRTDVDVQPVGAGSAGATSDFAQLEADFRDNFRSSHRGSDYEFDKAKPAYQYGYELASDRSRSADDWTTVESDARRRWEERSPGTWEKVKDAARYAYDRARSKTQA